MRPGSTGNVVFFFDFPEATRSLTKEQRSDLVLAIIYYARGDDPAQFLTDSVVKVAFEASFQGIVDRDKSLREKRRKAIQSRWNTNANNAIPTNTNTSTNTNTNTNTNTSTNTSFKGGGKPIGEYSRAAGRDRERLGNEKIL